MGLEVTNAGAGVRQSAVQFRPPHPRSGVGGELILSLRVSASLSVK